MRLLAPGFLIGILAVSALPVMPDPRDAWVLGAGGLLLPLMSRRIRVVLLAAMAGGIWNILVAHAALEARLVTPPRGLDRIVTGRVVGLPTAEPGRMRFLFSPDPLEGQQDLPSRMRISWYRSRVSVAAGERWRLSLRLRAPRGQVNPGGFDYERWLLLNGIGATGYVRNGSKNQLLEGSPGLWSAVRGKLADAIHRALPDSPRAGMIAALLVGAGRIDPEQRRLLQRTGTSHLMAISGLHVGIAAAVGALAGRMAWVLLPLRWVPLRESVTVAGGLSAAGLYAGLAGFALPTTRALLMIAAAAVLLLRRRALAPWLAFAFAMVVILAQNPLVPLGAGFWLSFGAVAGLLLVSPGLRGAGAPAGWLRAQWGVTVALAPVLAGIYGQVPLVSPLANLVAVPVFSMLIVPPVLLAGVACLICFPAGSFLLGVIDWLLSWLLSCLSWMAEAGPPVLEPVTAPLIALLPGMAGAVLALMPKGFCGRGAAPALLLPLVCWQGTAPADGTFTLTVLDVGQGLASVVRTRHHVLVFDTGPSWPGGNSGSTNLVPFFRSVGVRQIDLLVVSHPDLDHRGGVPGLLAGRRVRRIGGGLYPGMPIHTGDRCRAGQAWRWDGVSFRFLHPGPVAGDSDNDSSCVLRISSADGTTVLLTGDIEAGAERRLLRDGADLHADVVVAPHHGSRSSSTTAFVAAVDADWVIYPAGFGNRWGFPHADVRQRWGSVGAMMTGVEGAVEVRVTGRGGPLEVRGRRCADRRFWRWRQCD